MALVVAGAIISNGLLLLAQRARPAELAGQWELPGGKVEAGESPRGALRRELREELGVDTDIGAQIGADVPLRDGLQLRAYRAELVSGEPVALEHSAIDWVNAETILTKLLVTADREWLPHLLLLLTSPEPSPDLS